MMFFTQSHYIVISSHAAQSVSGQDLSPQDFLGRSGTGVRVGIWVTPLEDFEQLLWRGAWACFFFFFFFFFFRKEQTYKILERVYTLYLRNLSWFLSYLGWAQPFESTQPRHFFGCAEITRQRQGWRPRRAWISLHSQPSRLPQSWKIVEMMLCEWSKHSMTRQETLHQSAIFYRSFRLFLMLKALLLPVRVRWSKSTCHFFALRLKSPSPHS